MGVKSIINDDLAQEICDTIACSTKGLPTLCQMHDNWPCYQTIHEWILSNNQGFADKYAKAKQSQADYLCEDILRIIDKPETFTDENGFERNDVGMMRLKVDSMKWQASKLRPKKWGKLDNAEAQSPTDTLTKIQALVADFNKTNASDV